MKSSRKSVSVLIVALAVMGLVLDADARRGKRIQIAFGGSGIGAWEFPEKEVFVADDQYYGPIILRGSDSSPGDILDLPMPLQVGVGSTPFDRLWINENGYIVLGTAQSPGPSDFDQNLTDLAEFPDNIIAPFYADMASINTPGDGCMAGGSSGGACDVAYGVLSLDDPSDLDGLDIDYLNSFRVTWGAFERVDSETVSDSLGLPEAGSSATLFNRFQMHLIDRQDTASEGDFDIRFYYQGDIDWETQNTHIGFKLGPYVLDFSNYYNANRTHNGFLGEEGDCLDIGDESLIDSYLNPEERYPCNIVKVEFRGGVPNLVDYTADLSIELDSTAGPINATENFFVQANIENLGPQDETDVTLEATLPPGTEYVGVTPSNFDCRSDATNTAVICDIGDVAATAPPIVLSLELQSNNDGQQDYSVSAKGERFDPNPVNSSKSIELAIGSTADLQIDSCVANPPSIVVVGETVSLTCTVRNNGPQDATDVLLTSTLPPFVRFGSSNQCQASGQDVSCSISSIVSGADEPIVVDLNAVAVGDTLVSAGIQRGPENDSNLVNNTSEFRVAVAARQLVVNASSSSVPDAVVSNGSTNVVILGYRLNSNSSDVVLQSLVLSASGSGDDSMDVANVRVWLDVDSDGQVGSAEQLLGEGRYDRDNGTLEISFAQPLLLPNGDTDLLVTYDF